MVTVALELDTVAEMPIFFHAMSIRDSIRSVLALVYRFSNNDVAGGAQLNVLVQNDAVNYEGSTEVRTSLNDLSLFRIHSESSMPVASVVAKIVEHVKLLREWANDEMTTNEEQKEILLRRVSRGLLNNALYALRLGCFTSFWHNSETKMRSENVQDKVVF